MSTFNPFGTTVTAAPSVVEAMEAQMRNPNQSCLILKGVNTRKGATAETLGLLRESDPECIAVSFSVGSGGKGNSRLDLSGAAVPSVNAALAAFDLKADQPDYSGLTPAQCVERTICREKVKDSEDVVSFKLSVAAHSRAVRVPVSEWDAFLDFMDNVGEWTEDAISYYLAELQKADEAPVTTTAIDGTETTTDGTETIDEA